MRTVLPLVLWRWVLGGLCLGNVLVGRLWRHTRCFSNILYVHKDVIIDGKSFEACWQCKAMRNFEHMTDLMVLECGAKLYNPRESMLNCDLITVGTISFQVNLRGHNRQKWWIFLSLYHFSSFLYQFPVFLYPAGQGIYQLFQTKTQHCLVDRRTQELQQLLNNASCVYVQARHTNWFVTN